jgi:hypothetical protein
METYRIIPLGRAYRVEAVQPNGQTRVVRTWPTKYQRGLLDDRSRPFQVVGDAKPLAY